MGKPEVVGSGSGSYPVEVILINMIIIANKPLAVNGDLSLSLSLQVDILHPLTSIQWREACRLPVKMRDAQSVLMHGTQCNCKRRSDTW